MSLLNWIGVQQGLEIHGLEECGPWRYTVFNWFPKHLRYTDFGQKPWRYTVFDFLVKNYGHSYKVFQFLWLDYFVSQVKCNLAAYHSIRFWVFLSNNVQNDLWLFQLFLAFFNSLYQELSGYVSHISLVLHIYPQEV